MPAPAPRPSPLLEGRELDTYYGQSHVLRGVSIRIGAGETIGLMGRNGMGKTTLIRTLVGLVRPRGGSVLLDGEDVTRLPTFAIARRGIAYVPEGRGIFATPQRGGEPGAGRAGRDGGGRRRLDQRARARALSAPGRAPRPTAATSSRAASSRCWPSAAPC